MRAELKPCPLCGSTNVTCFAEYEGDSYDNEPIYRAVVACLGCHEERCSGDYDEEPCFGIEAYYPQRHPLIKDIEDPSDCERVLERHMAERWNSRAERTCRVKLNENHDVGEPAYICTSCGALMEDKYVFIDDVDGGVREFRFCPNCGAKVVR